MKNDEIAKACSGVLQKSKKIEIYFGLNPPKEKLETVGLEYSLGGHTTLSGIRLDILYSNSDTPVIAEVKSGNNYKGREVRDQLKDYQHCLKEFLREFGNEKQPRLIAILPENNNLPANSYIASKTDIELFTYNEDNVLDKFKDGYNTPQDLINVARDGGGALDDMGGESSFKSAKKM